MTLLFFGRTLIYVRFLRFLLYARYTESGDEVIDSAILGIDDSYGLSGGLISTLEDNDDPSYSYSLSAGLGSTPEDNDDSSYSFDFD